MEIIYSWITHYGYFGLFSLLMLGIVGLPIPDETLLTFSGYLIYAKKFSMPFTILSAFLGSVCGITISYMLGRSIGLFLLRKYGRYIFITPEKLDLVHHWFLRKGKWALAIGYFIPGVRHLTAYTAGATKLELREFMMFAYSGGLIWSLTFIFLGYSFGRHWRVAIDRFQENILIGSIVILVLLIAGWFVKKKFVKI
jgi:membrane protein DedA with SNARE-associated domain